MYVSIKLVTFCLFLFSFVDKSYSKNCNAKINETLLSRLATRCTYHNLQDIRYPNCNYLHIRKDTMSGQLQFLEPSYYENTIMGFLYSYYQIDTMCSVSFFGSKIKTIMHEEIKLNHYNSTIKECSMYTKDRCISYDELFDCTWMKENIKTNYIIRRTHLTLNFNSHGKLIYPYQNNLCSIRDTSCNLPQGILKKPGYLDARSNGHCNMRIVYSTNGFFYENPDTQTYTFHDQLHPVSFMFNKSNTKKDKCIIGSINIEDNFYTARFIPNVETISIDREKKFETDYLSLGHLQFLYDYAVSNHRLIVKTKCEDLTKQYLICIELAKLGKWKCLISLLHSDKNIVVYPPSKSDDDYYISNIVTTVNEDNVNTKLCTIPNNITCINNEIQQISDNILIVNKELNICYNVNDITLIDCPSPYSLNNSFPNATIILNNNKYLSVQQGKIILGPVSIITHDLYSQVYTMDSWEYNINTDYPNILTGRVLPNLQVENDVVYNFIKGILKFIYNSKTTITAIIITGVSLISIWLMIKLIKVVLLFRQNKSIKVKDSTDETSYINLKAMEDGVLKFRNRGNRSQL